VSLLSFLDIGLAFLVVTVAVSTIVAQDLFAAVVSYVAYGLLLAFVWIRLYAPDVALTEAAVGSGVTGVLLITAGKRLAAIKKAEPEANPTLSLRLLTGFLAALVACALATAVLMLPEVPPSLAPEAAAAANGPGAGLGNPITAVLISYRSFDTMLEKIVLILAVVGVWSVGTDKVWGNAPAPLGRPAPSPEMAFLAQMLAPIGTLIGVHVFWVGADAPGGAFQGGALLGLVAGPAVFLIVGLAGAPMAGSFFAYPKDFAKPIILLIETFMVLSIAVALPMLVAGPPSERSEP
jgi:multisubunit Na+/H+ antiporter MnhB subunit